MGSPRWDVSIGCCTPAEVPSPSCAWTYAEPLREAKSGQPLASYSPAPAAVSQRHAPRVHASRWWWRRRSLLLRMLLPAVIEEVVGWRVRPQGAGCCWILPEVLILVDLVGPGGKHRRLRGSRIAQGGQHRGAALASSRGGDGTVGLGRASVG